MYNPTEVCWFDSTMTGAPTMAGNTVGTLIPVLDACLVNGFNSQTLTSLVVSGGVATATKTAHGFWDHTVVEITGATPTDLNGKKRITWIDANSFTFNAVGIANCTATGTILAKMAPGGWTKTTLSTNVCYYTKPSLILTDWALYIDDNYTTYAFWGAISPGGSIFYGNGATNIYFLRNIVAGNRAWAVFCDGHAVYIWIDPRLGSTTSWRANAFCDLISFSNSNANDCYVAGCANTSSGTNNLMNLDGSISGGLALAPGSPAFQLGMRGSGIGNSGYSTLGIDGTQHADGTFHCAPIEVWDNYRYGPRGIMPGFYSSMHDYSLASHGTILTYPQSVRNPQLRDHRIRLMATIGNQSGVIAMDITGPWYPHQNYYGAYRIYGTAKKQGAVGRFPLALMVKDSGQIIRKTMSAADGTYAFNNIDYLYQGYVVVEYDGEVTDPLNAAIADLVTPVAMP